MGSSVAIVAGSASLRLSASTKSDFIRINSPPMRKANATSQYLARLIRPSKLNRNDLKPMGSSGMPTTARGLALGSRRALLRFDASPAGSRRRVSAVRHKFHLALLLPARPRIACIGWRQRIGPEPVRPARSSQAEHLDKPPDAQAELDCADEEGRGRVVNPVPQPVKKTRGNQERDDPPPALVAIVQPLDRGGRQKPRAEDEDRSSHHID